MLFKTAKNDFSDAITKLSRIVTNKTSLPVLEGILIEADDGKITLTAYNLEMSMKKEIYAKVEIKGSIVVGAKLLSDIIRRMNGDMIEFESDARLMCHIKSESAVFDIIGMAAADFPEMPGLEEGKKLNINSKELLEMVNGTAFAVSPVEGTRPILMGINISVVNNNLKFVAIDGYRLAIRNKKIENTEDMNFVIYGRSLFEACKLIADEEEDVEILVGYKMISFKVCGYTLICRLLEGEFVNYQKTIPLSHKQRIVVKVRDIINITERISLLISDTFSTPIRCIISEENATFSCATSVGRATETYSLDLEGDPFEIGLSSRYLLEALKAVDDDTVQILFDEAKQGVVISPLEGDDYMYMIMPMRLK